MRIVVLAALAVFLHAGAAAAQATPKFEFGKAEEVKAVEWKVQAKGGLLLTAGNSQTTNAAFGLNASRKEGNNKLAVEGGMAYGKSNVRVPVVDATNMITGINHTSITTTNNWLAKGRYDRFFTTNNSGYASALAGADRIAGRSFAGGGQIGYSRQLLKNDLNLLVAEIGYDFSYERYVQQPMKTLDPVSIHSARVFVGEALKLSAETGATASVEALFNLNKENAALQVDTGPPATLGVGPFKDTRITGKAALTTTLRKSLSVALGVTLRYDQNPAPLPVPSGSPAGAAYAANFQPFAEKVDTIAEATLIYTFL